MIHVLCDPWPQKSYQPTVYILKILADNPQSDLVKFLLLRQSCLDNPWPPPPHQSSPEQRAGLRQFM